MCDTRGADPSTKLRWYLRDADIMGQIAALRLYSD